MSQINLANIFLEATTSMNASVNHTRGSQNYQAESFSQNLFKAKETINRSEVHETKRSEAHLVQKEKSNDTITQEKNNTQDKTSIQDDQVVKDENKATSIDEVNELSNQDEQESCNEIKAIEEQILALVSQGLQMPIEDIQVQLEALGLQVQDLLSEEGFGKFINQLFTNGDIEALLSGDVDIKQMSTLFNQLATYAKEMQSVLGELNEQAHMEAEVALQTTDEIEAGIVEHGILEEEMLSENILDETLNTSVAQDGAKGQEQISDEPILTFASDESHVDSGLGITVPIHNFTTTSFTQTFQTDIGVIAQTTTKQMINGKSFIEQVDFKVLSQTKEINVTLSPKELGQMNIKIVEQNGTMVAEIKVDNEKAKDFILNEINTLKENLEEQGLNVTDVKVDIRQDSHQSQMEQEKQKSSKRIQEIISKHLNENEEELNEAIDESPIISDSEIDYMV